MMLNETEVRVLGALIEKQITTPEYYPLTLNALTAACNQKNNRNPVMSLTENEVENALDSLREKNLAYVFHGSTSRVPKFKHVAPEILQLNPAELAVMCVLMLSGPQTAGEIRTRGSRLYEFKGLDEVDEILRALSTRDPEPLVTKLPRHPGQKESRFAQLLTGAVQSEEVAPEPAPHKRAPRTQGEEVRELTHRVDSLTQQVEELQQQFQKFKKQFE